MPKDRSIYLQHPDWVQALFVSSFFGSLKVIHAFIETFFILLHKPRQNPRADSSQIPQQDGLAGYASVPE